MTERAEELGARAAESTNALNPLIGISREDVMAAVGSILGGAVRQPFHLLQRVGSFGKNFVDIVTGDSEIKPDPKDRRFGDPAWQYNFLYKRLAQTWMALSKETQTFIQGLDLDDVNRARALLIASIAVDAVAPTNSLLGNPGAIKRAIDTGGLSLVKGLQHAISDMRHNGMMPSQVDKRPFKVGENLATSEGAVVFKTEMLELIQYKPKTDQVFETPLFIIPPQINKFYVMDLDKPKSLIRYMLKQGHQVFVVSWRNPQAEQRDWGLADYVRELIGAIEVTRAISGSKKVNVSGGCSGGITLSTLLSHLAATKKDLINVVTLMVCVLDPRPLDSEFGVLVTQQGIEMARKRSAKKGVLSGADLGRTFAWLRPNDLIWNYVVNNYLMGNEPPAFDVLYWNNDSTNLPAKLHSDYLALYEQQPMANPGTVEFMGETLDLRKVTNEAFIVAGITDHITPWKACYRTTQLWGGKTNFILSNSGHIQSLINPPGNPKAKYFFNPEIASTAEEWLSKAKEMPGSWWELWALWLQERAGPKKDAPKSLGNKKYKPGDPAPGTYVHG